MSELLAWLDMYDATVQLGDALHWMADDLVRNSKPEDPEAARILRDNLWELYL